MGKSIHPKAAEIIALAKEWVTMTRLETPFQFFAVGSIFRPDFDPERSDLDLVVVVDDNIFKEAMSAVDSLQTLSAAVELLRKKLEDRGFSSNPVSPSLYYLSEIKANVHRSGDPDYYTVTDFVPLAEYDSPFKTANFPANKNNAVLSKVINKVIGYVQDVRHHYLQNPNTKSWINKDWEKLFHNLRRLLRISGLFDVGAGVADKKTIVETTRREFPDSELPFATLYQSLVPGYKTTEFPPEELLLACEAVVRLAWQLAARSFRDWTFPETRYFVSDSLGEELVQAKRTDIFAVDEGVALYLPPGWNELPQRLDIKKSGDSSVEVLEDPSHEDIFNFDFSQFDKDVFQYLYEHSKLPAKGSYQTKLGLGRVDVPNPRIGLGLTLTVYPLTYWVVKEFNRRILTKPDANLAQIKRKMLSDILTQRADVEFRCPSALYVEFCVITSDNKLVLAEKNANLSVLASAGYRWTATIEEGLTWRDFRNVDSIDLRAVVVKGLAAELQTTVDEINETKFFGLALETTHFNTAVIGEVTLSTESSIISRRLESSEDFGRNYRFIDIEEAFDTLFVETDISPRDWHPLGRMRSLFSLYRRLSRDRFWNLNGTKEK